MEIRQARADDYEAVAAFTRETWSERQVGDYIPDIYHEWIEGDGPDQRTFVADAGEDIAGLCQSVLLSEHEAWAQGMRVNPDHRGRGVADALNEAHFAWARDRDAAVCRNMVFSWNRAGLGASRGGGFEPCTEFRWAHPTPDADAAAPLTDATAALDVTADPDAAWSFWQRSAACDHLQGLTLDPEETWALSEATRERFHRAADETAVVAVRGSDATRACTFRTRTFEREADGGDAAGADDDGDADTALWAEYGVAAWADLPAAGTLLAAVARDAAAVGADRTRVLIPETVRFVSDAAYAGADVSDHPDFVLAADLTGRRGDRD